MKNSIFITLALAWLCSCHGVRPILRPGPGADSTPDNWRQAHIGSWAVEFVLDSVSGRIEALERWHAGSPHSVRGILRIRGILTGKDSTIVRTRLDVDLAGHTALTLSCLDLTSATMTRHEAQLSIAFPPRRGDCWLSMNGQLFPDSMVGTWEEHSVAGTIKRGPFKMVRFSR